MLLGFVGLRNGGGAIKFIGIEVGERRERELKGGMCVGKARILEQKKRRQSRVINRPLHPERVIAQRDSENLPCVDV